MRLGNKYKTIMEDKKMDIEVGDMFKKKIGDSCEVTCVVTQKAALEENKWYVVFRDGSCSRAFNPIDEGYELIRKEGDWRRAVNLECFSKPEPL
jgi:hypothetical protein